MLTYKAEHAGRDILAVRAASPSLALLALRHAASETRLTPATFRCPACAFALPADIYAARNIVAAGRAVRPQPPRSRN